MVGFSFSVRHGAVCGDRGDSDTVRGVRMSNQNGKEWDEAAGEYAWQKGMSLDEIAAVLHITRNQAKHALYHGLEKLRESRNLKRLYAEKK